MIMILSGGSCFGVLVTSIREVALLQSMTPLHVVLE